MYKFKKGDMVFHKPSGCVGVYEHDTHHLDLIMVATPKDFEWWEVKDCHPVPTT